MKNTLHVISVCFSKCDLILKLYNLDVIPFKIHLCLIIKYAHVRIKLFFKSPARQEKKEFLI